VRHRHGTRYSAGGDNRTAAAGSPPPAAHMVAIGVPELVAVPCPRPRGRGRAAPGTYGRAAPAATATASVTAGAVIGLAGLVAVAAFAARWASRRAERAEVSGDSMAPALQPGDRLLVWRTRRLKRGDIVAVADPRDPERTMLKRAAELTDGSIYLLGDNEMHSTDSRHFGPVPRSLARGKAIYRYAPPGRTGRLRGGGEPGLGGPGAGRSRPAATPSGTPPASPPSPPR
jgi:nickel-type superoxide dismutase maturation protease